MAICARGDAGPGRVLRCRLPLVKVRISDGWSEDQLRASLNLKAPSILHTCARIVTELYEPGFAAPLLIESLCNTLAVDIVRYFTTLPPLRSDRGGLAPWRLKRIDERVAADGPPPSIDDLVSLCGLGRRHLIRSFKLSRQENIGDYVARIRLEKAKHMLAAHFNITEIASHLGFASLASFSTTFKRATGMAPRSYQRADFRPEKEKPA
jgi:AraC family transcriptional regulator